jgi:hypothetical protein
MIGHQSLWNKKVTIGKRIKIFYVIQYCNTHTNYWYKKCNSSPHYTFFW